MEAVLGLFGIAVFVGIAILLQKAQTAVGETVNKKLLFKREYQEGLQLLEPVRFEIKAPVSDVLESLSTHVTAQKTTPDGLMAVVYCAHKSSDKIIYRLGNKLVPKSFEMVVAFTKLEQTTAVAYQFISWTEDAGILRGQDEMRLLKHQIESSILKFEQCS